jgi:hypothetical protein
LGIRFLLLFKVELLAEDAGFAATWIFVQESTISQLLGLTLRPNGTMRKIVNSPLEEKRL